MVPQIWEYGNLSVRKLIYEYSLSSPGNQDYQKIIFFSSRKVEIDNAKVVFLLELVVIINESWYNQAYIFLIIEILLQFLMKKL